MNKKILRNQMQERLNEISKPLYEHLSYEIARTLFETSEWKTAHTIAITVSKPPEVDTYQIIRKAWDEGKEIVVPKCYPNDKRMLFRKLTSFNELESVYFGLLEPIEKFTVEYAANEIDLMIVPGIAFSRSGFRLGFGGGYYDRYLENYDGITISLAFSCQLVDELPIESHDQSVSKIITEKELIISHA
ncbi:5-formyltetrahydrofolate cyclo-ligase [Cytobacillus spongiae]|uniref:5-formyltetrahydrofolate cyclo-ligase n=1 Tax=Cytobacillus spongiae TaxID=2901381 RepID=UPI001F36C7A7|nr:5-formyltetrahydrofolate cyclo-ligase [Cytobacillus spongiae]UII54864.1 5-formyltetrahydrofolate cyclo-ligase [Cytobacillus spongiae]